jgi:hypothetical protein
VARHLDGEAGRGPESVEAEAAAGPDARHEERAIADDAATQEGGCRRVPEAVRDRQRDVRPHDHPLREPAVTIPGREARIRAQVLAAAGARPARPAGSREPADGRAIADRPAGHGGAHGLDATHDLVARDRGEPVGGEVALDELEVGPAHGAGAYAEEQLAGTRRRVGHLAEAERLSLGERAGPLQDEGAHHGALTGR